MSDQTSAPQALEKLITRAENAGVSDIHLQMQNGKADVSFRLDGVMNPAGGFDDGLAERVFGRIKYLARLKTYQESLPQDGRIDRADVGAEHDIRVATYPTVTGEKIVLRMFSESSQTLNELDLAPLVREALEAFLVRSSGMMLLTGPAGSGKTTTIYACLRHIAAQGGRHVITIEDPAEQIVPGIMQTEVNEAAGLDFAKAARHLLRQDPQVLVIGEIRDNETAGIAVRAAMTGHLVIATLHAGSCRGVFERLLSMCDDRPAVAGATELVLNQRLIRKLCPDCAGSGCDACLETGYRGRAPVVEFIHPTDDVRALIRNGELNRIAPKSSLADAAKALLERGLVDQREITRIIDA